MLCWSWNENPIITSFYYHGWTTDCFGHSYCNGDEGNNIIILITVVLIMIMMMGWSSDLNSRVYVIIIQNKAWAICVACPPVAFPLLLPCTRKSSSRLCYLIWAFCAMYAVSRDLVGRLCKHSVTGCTHVYLLKHQSHTEAVKETQLRLAAQHTQWEWTCGITFKCNQSSANQTIGWACFS